jgi:MFS family permease
LADPTFQSDPQPNTQKIPTATALSDTSPEAKRWHVGTLTYTSAGLVAIFCWLLWGDFSWALKDRSVQSVLQVLLKKYGASNLVMSLFLVSLPALYSVIVGPIVSYRSDRTRTRWGRRIPYLIVATPFAALSMFGLAVSPRLAHMLHGAFQSLGERGTTLLMFGVFWSVIGIATVTINNLFNALINDVVPREVLGRFFGLFRMFSLLAGAIFNHKIFAYAETQYFWIFVGLGLTYGVGFTLMCLNVKEGEYPPPPDIIESSQPGFWHASRLYLVECFAQPYYLWVIVAFVVGNLAFLPFNTYSIPFSGDLHIPNQQYGNYIALTYLISIVLTYPLGIMVDRTHPLHVAIVTLILYAAMSVWGAVYSVDPKYFGIALVAHGVLSGVYFTGTAAYTQMLFPRSRFAQFFSAYWLVTSLIQATFGLMVGKYLDFVHSDYRQTFYMGAAIAFIGALCTLEVYRRFKKYGGVKAYVAPE